MKQAINFTIEVTDYSEHKLFILIRLLFDSDDFHFKVVIQTSKKFEMRSWINVAKSAQRTWP